MTDQPEAPSQSPQSLRRILLDVSPPNVAHLLTWTRVGAQILLEVGYFDLVAINQQVMTEPDIEKRTLDWFVTHRFVVDLATARRFVDAMADLGKELVRHKSQEASIESNDAKD